MSLLALALAVSVSAEPPRAGPHRLRWEPKVDLPVTAALVGGWVLTEMVFKHQLAPTACHWCDVNGFDTGVRRLFNPTLTPSGYGVALPDMLSNVVGFAALPLALVGLDALWAHGEGALLEAWPTDLVLILESTFAALAVTQATKFLVGRARPYTVGAPADALAAAKDPLDHNLSFFSGHTTFAFGLAVSAGLVARQRGYKHAWVTWAVGLPLAAATAGLRLAADKHWATDVLVGLAVSTAASLGVVLLLHGRDDGEAHALRLSAGPGGVALSYAF